MYKKEHNFIIIVPAYVLSRDNLITKLCIFSPMWSDNQWIWVGISGLDDILRINHRDLVKSHVIRNIDIVLIKTNDAHLCVPSLLWKLA